MAVPKKKTSQSRRNMRRAHHALTSVHSMECPNCGERKLPHHLCVSCGHYNGKVILRTKVESSTDEEKGPL